MTNPTYRRPPIDPVIIRRGLELIDELERGRELDARGQQDLSDVVAAVLRRLGASERDLTPSVEAHIDAVIAENAAVLRPIIDANN